MSHNDILFNHIVLMKDLLENAITTSSVNGVPRANGALAKEGLIRSKALIEILHEAVKNSLVLENTKAKNIFPPLGVNKPELKISGFLKKKAQDICVVPDNIQMERTKIEWGPLAFESQIDPYGQEYTENTLIINVRSQLSSLSNNTDTLFERTFAEATNLHTIYPKIVLGELYLIPVYEYDSSQAKHNRVAFSNTKTNLEKYISFFTSINRRQPDTRYHNKNYDIDYHKYEKCALVIVDFSKNIPKIYSSTHELIEDGLVSPAFPLELSEISYESLFSDLLSEYSNRFNIKNIIE